jgi:hypothetical protein
MVVCPESGAAPVAGESMFSLVAFCPTSLLTVKVAAAVAWELVSEVAMTVSV